MIHKDNEIMFSVITVCLNPGDDLKHTVDSVVSQSYKNWELVIKDGGSTDGCLGEIAKDERIKVTVKKDSGIYNAMNQAIELSNGKYIIFMNAGDTFARECVLEDVTQFINNNENAEVVYGDYINSRTELCKLPSNITKSFLYRTFLCHQAIFYKKEIIGFYDESFRLLADHDLNVKLVNEDKTFLKIPVPVCKYKGGGVSEKAENLKTHAEEFEKIRHRYFTKKEIFVFKLKRILTFPALRKLMYSSSSPASLRKLYRFVVTQVRK